MSDLRDFERIARKVQNVGKLDVVETSGVHPFDERNIHPKIGDAFNGTNPKIKLTQLVTQSEIDEQNGYRFIFAGSMSAIRNPRGHDILIDPIDRCLDHLSFASVLLRTLENRIAPTP